MLCLDARPRSSGGLIVKRREFIALAGSAGIMPFAAHAQPSMPVIGYLNSTPPETIIVDRLRGFHQGLKDSGYVERDNVAIEYRWADNQLDRLPGLAADLVQRGVAVIAAASAATAFAAQSATKTIPVVFMVGEDPVKLGLVASLARPGGNLTGINFFTVELASKRLEVLRELVPAIKRVAVLVSPANASVTEATLKDLGAAAHAMGLQVQVFNADTDREIDAAYAALARDRPDALYVSSGPFFTSRRVQLTQLAARHAIPAIYAGRALAEVGGLISYGASLPDAFHQMGIYTGRVLKGVNPADLPVVQSTKLELVINAQTARMLGLTVAPSLLARADEVIE